jgi:plasmid stabilization system protein ParE
MTRRKLLMLGERNSHTVPMTCKAAPRSLSLGQISVRKVSGCSMAQAEIDFHPEAREEYLDALRWYLDRSVHVARRFQEEIIRCLELIAGHPDRCPIWEGTIRWARLRRFPYVLYYESSDAEHIQVLAVAHGSRRPGYWRSRHHD